MMMKVCRKKLSFLAGATVMLGALTTVPAAAQTIPLAGFTQSTSGTPFTYSANPGFADATISASTLVDFNFLTPAAFGAPAGTFLNATLTMVGVLNTAADAATGAGLLNQPFNITSFEIRAAGSGDLLLGMTAIPNNPFVPVQPSLGNAAPTSTSISLIGTSQFANIVFTSDVATIPLTGAKDFSLSFTSLPTRGPGAADDGLLLGPDGDFLDFTASMSGVFGAEAVPEPGSVAMLIGLGVTGSAVMFRRRRQA